MSEDDPTKRKPAAPREGWEDEAEFAPGSFVKIANDYSFYTPYTQEVRQQMEEDGIDLEETYCLIGIIPGDESTEGVDVAYIARRDAPELVDFMETFKRLTKPVGIDHEYRDRLFHVPYYVLEAANVLKN